MIRLKAPPGLAGTLGSMIATALPQSRRIALLRVPGGIVAHLHQYTPGLQWQSAMDIGITVHYAVHIGQDIMLAMAIRTPYGLVRLRRPSSIYKSIP